MLHRGISSCCNIFYVYHRWYEDLDRITEVKIIKPIEWIVFSSNEKNHHVSPAPYWLLKTRL